MAITFEEEKSFNKILAAVLLTIVVLGAGGFLGWKLFSIGPSGIPVAMDITEPKMNLAPLKDTRIKTIELYPEIPAPVVTSGRVNPFTESNGEPVADKATIKNDVLGTNSVPVSTDSSAKSASNGKTEEKK